MRRRVASSSVTSNRAGMPSTTGSACRMRAVADVPAATTATAATTAATAAATTAATTGTTAAAAVATGGTVASRAPVSVVVGVSWGRVMPVCSQGVLSVVRTRTSYDRPRASPRTRKAVSGSQLERISLPLTDDEDHVVSEERRYCTS